MTAVDGGPATIREAGSPPRKRLGRIFVVAWFTCVGLALLLVLAIATIPNEIEAHLPIWPYGMLLVLVVALLGLPLLVAAVILDRR